MAKIERAQKLFLKALKEKFAGEDPAGLKDRYKRKGLEQSPRKREFLKEGKKVEMERGISQYDPNAATSAVSRSGSASS
jgi:methyl-coenzyme M reductase alpha subunit